MFASRVPVLMLIASTILVVAPATLSPSPVSGQDVQPKKDSSSTQHTQFAPGVITVIPPAPEPKETVMGPITMKNFLDAHPQLEWSEPTFPGGAPHFDPGTRTVKEMAQKVIFRREIYCLEFSFKPLRQIYIDLPRPDGQLQRKLVWYMVYRVRYRGGDLRPAADKIGDTEIFKRLESISYESRRFFPLIYLVDLSTGQRHLDYILPSAKQKIAVREQISAPLHNSVEISRVKIDRSSDDDAPGIWGIVTWEDIRPDIDFLSVNVSGLTNAFEQDGEGDEAPYRRKSLSLNFFRPGDAVNQTADEIRFGVPAFQDVIEQANILSKYDLDERLDYRWIFQSVK